MTSLLLGCILIIVCAPLTAAHGGDEASVANLPPRPLWTSSRVVGFPDPPPPYQVERVYPRLEFEKPLAVGRFPDGHRLWVITHKGGYGGPGRVYLFEDDQDVTGTELFLERPEILYGLAFHPQFAENGYLFVGCNGRSESLGKKATRVLRFKVETTPPFRCDPDSASVIIEWPSDGHNGGDVAFGPDGMLYISSGDGTSDSDPHLAGQDLSTLTASILRIDVDHPSEGRAYSIPSDNPFAETSGARPEIWSYGLRNPWRITYDHPSNQLWAGNNGQDLWETVHLIRRGENYGWSANEGGYEFQADRPRGPTPIIPPTLEHHHSEARSLTGGVVYRGDALPLDDGTYIYGDYSTGNIWGAVHDGRTLTSHQHLARSSLQITGFGQNFRGDLLVVDHGGGLYRLVPQSRDAEPVRFPQHLSETGLFASVENHQVNPGVIPYDVNAPLWSDGADKLRYLAVPGEGAATYHPSKGWECPDGTVLVKTFLLNVADEGTIKSRRIETRLFTRQEGEWYGYSYEWNDDQTDATLVESSGKDREFPVCETDAADSRPLRWRFPSRAECMVCHSRAANFVLGLSTPQINRDYDYGSGPVNQLAALAHWGVLRSPAKGDDASEEATANRLPQPPDALPRLTRPDDETAPLTARVRSYLHANCANCHVEAGGGNSLMNLAFEKALDKTRIVGITPQHDRLGIDDAAIIAPGAPERSILLARVSRRGRGQMPPLGTNRVDPQAVALISAWIASLELETSE